jgi:hypothetical protein
MRILTGKIVSPEGPGDQAEDKDPARVNPDLDAEYLEDTPCGTHGHPPFFLEASRRSAHLHCAFFHNKK